MGRRKSDTQPTVVSDNDKFWRLMTTPLCEVSDEDLLWASQQSQLNSYTSKMVWMYEIKHRKEKKKQQTACYTQKQH